MYRAICPKHPGPYAHLDIDMDPFPRFGVRGGGLHEVHVAICTQHQEPYPYSNIPVDMDLFPELGSGSREESITKCTGTFVQPDFH